MYENLDDKDVVKLAQQGDTDALEHIMQRYTGIVIYLAKNLKRGCIELEDFIQEGRIGLYHAVKSYNNKVECSFKTFVILCVKRALITNIIHTYRIKRKTMLQTVPIKYECDYQDISFCVELEDTRLRPDEILERKEFITFVFDNLDKLLPKYQVKVLKLQMLGYKYKEIAKMLNTDKRKVENTLNIGRKNAKNRLLRKIQIQFWRIM